MQTVCPYPDVRGTGILVGDCATIDRRTTLTANIRGELCVWTYRESARTLTRLFGLCYNLAHIPAGVGYARACWTAPVGTALGSSWIHDKRMNRT
jgi:hypothetical protein